MYGDLLPTTEEKTIRFQTLSSHKEQFNCKGSTVAISDSFPYITGSDDIEHFRPDAGAPLGNFLVWINKDRLSSLDSDGFKQWLSQNPMTVYYEFQIRKMWGGYNEFVLQFVTTKNTGP